MLRWNILLAAALALPGVFGCADGSAGSADEPRSTVTGLVTLDGQPLPKGTISFGSEKDIAEGTVTFGEIENGEYSLEVTAGKKQVKVSVLEEVGEADETGLKDTQEAIPAKYNSETELEADVAASGTNKFDFDLKSN